MKSNGSKLYVLDETGSPKVEQNAQAWAKFMKNPENLVIARSDLGPRGEVMTLFLGQDGRRKKNPLRAPLLWETRVYGGLNDGQATRHPDKGEALSSHGLMVKTCLGEL